MQMFLQIDLWAQPCLLCLLEPFAAYLGEHTPSHLRWRVGPGEARPLGQSDLLLPRLTVMSIQRGSSRLCRAASSLRFNFGSYVKHSCCEFLARTILAVAVDSCLFHRSENFFEIIFNMCPLMVPPWKSISHSHLPALEREACSHGVCLWTWPGEVL